MAAIALHPELRPGPGARERFTATLTYALAVHLVLLLGIKLQSGAPQRAPSPPPLEILLVSTPPKPTVVEPKRADYLAQHTHEGSGRAATPAPPETRARGGATASAAPTPAAAPAPPAPPAASARAPRPELVAPRARQTVPAPRPKVDPAPPPPSAAQLLAGVSKLAEVRAREGQRDNVFGKARKVRYVDASTRDYQDAAYLEAWRQKVESIGNLNYPQRARELGLTGTLRLSVRVAADGRVLDTRLLRSSGHPELDQAALDIVRLAAPYGEFNPKLRAQADELVITRTWQFTDHSLKSGP